jgi:hypothetical protein
MKPAVAHAAPLLVIDRQADKTVFVFLLEESNPARCPSVRDEPVVLDLLPPADRFGRPGVAGVIRPLLGRRPEGLTHFREFRTSSDLLRHGFVPVSHYRVCDTWDDYHSPWSVFSPEQPTEPGTEDSSVASFWKLPEQR